LRKAEAPVSASMGGVRATERTMPTITAPKSKKSSGSGRSSGSWMDTIAAQATVNPGRIAESNQEMLNFLRPSNLGPMVAGAGPGGALLKAGGAVAKEALGNLPKFVPLLTGAAQRVPQAVSNVASAGQGVIGQAANRASQAASSITPSIATKFANMPVAPMVGAAVGGSLMPTVSAPGPSSVTGGPSAVNQPTVVDNTTQNSVVNQPIGNSMGVPTGGQGIYGGGQNTMTPTGPSQAEQDAFMSSVNAANRPGFLGQGNAMAPPQEQTVAMPEQPPVGMYDPKQAAAELNEVFGNINEQNAALMLKLSEQLLGQIDTLEADLRKQYEQQGSVLDPATQAALKEMRAEVDRRRQGLQEEMNRRGLLQSGILLQEENRILGNQLTAEEKLLAGRVADIQNRMTDALMRLGQERVNTMGQLAQNQMQTSQWTQGQQLSAMNNLNSRNDQWNQWWQGQLASQKKEAEATRQFNVTSAETVRHNQATEANQMNKGSYSDSATSRYMQQIPTYPSLEEALADFQRFRSVMEGEKADTQRILNTIYAHFGV
jgi:hypothetical protein